MATQVATRKIDADTHFNLTVDYRDLMRSFRRALRYADAEQFAAVVGEGFEWHNHWFSASDPVPTAKVAGTPNTNSPPVTKKPPPTPKKPPSVPTNKPSNNNRNGLTTTSAMGKSIFNLGTAY